MKAKRFCFLFLSAVFVFVPFALEVGLGRPTVSQKYFFQLAAFAGAAAYGLGRILGWIGTPPRDWLRPWILLYAVALGVAAWRSPVWQVSAIYTLFPLALIAFYVVAFAYPWTRGEFERLVCLMALFGFVAAAYGIAEGFGVELLPYTAGKRHGKAQFMSVFGNPNFAASYLGPVLVLVASLPLWRTGRVARPPLKVWLGGWVVLMAICAAGWLKFSHTAVLIGAGLATLGVGAWAAGVFTALSAATLGLFLVLASVRSVWLGLAAAFFLTVVFFLFARGKAARKWGVGVLAVFGVIGVAGISAMPFFGIDLKKRILDSGPIYSRIYSFSIASDMIRARPLSGWGYEGFQVRYYDFVLKRQAQPGAEIYNDFLIRSAGVPAGEVHNDLLEIAVDCGLVGVAAVVGMVAAFVVLLVGVMRRAKDAKEGMMFFFVMMALVVVAIDGMFSFPLRLPASGMLAWGLLAVGSRMGRESDGETESGI